jgi:hypothetical protein
MVVAFPSGLESTLVEQGSTPELLLLLTGAVVGAERVGATIVDEVGKGNGVSVGKAV